jgi:23S rRNA (uracil1939-C5)-methyltransferase
MIRPDHRKSPRNHNQTPREQCELRIDKLVYGGDGLGRLNGKVVFVPFSAPGDEVLARTIESRKGFARAEIREILRPGSSRRVAACPHFGVCGGCHWQHIGYSAQLEAKLRILEEIFHHRFPETRGLAIGMKPCPVEYGYRSRARIQVRLSPTGVRLGFYRVRSHAVEQIEACPLLRPSLNNALAALGDLSAAYLRSGSISELEIAASEENRKWIWASPGDDAMSGGAPGFAGEKADPLLVRKVRGVDYSVSPLTFFQANDFMVSDLVSCVTDLVKESGPRTALDLYCGVGLFSLPLAQQVDEVIAVESTPVSATLCRGNALAAGLSNVRVVRAESGEWLESIGAASAAGIDLVLLNPPRTGAGLAVMDRLTRIAAETVIYVSCDPQTLARDLQRLTGQGYRIDYLEGLDLFPQTYHFETVVRVRRG